MLSTYRAIWLLVLTRAERDDATQATDILIIVDAVDYSYRMKFDRILMLLLSKL
jgi:hypothetical protein